MLCQAIHLAIESRLQLGKPASRLAVQRQRRAIQATDQPEVVEQRRDALPLLLRLDAQVLGRRRDLDPWIDASGQVKRSLARVAFQQS